MELNYNLISLLTGMFLGYVARMLFSYLKEN